MQALSKPHSKASGSRVSNISALTLMALSVVASTGCSVVSVGEQSFFCERTENKNKTVCSGVQTVYKATSGSADTIPREAVRLHSAANSLTPTVVRSNESGVWPDQGSGSTPPQTVVPTPSTVVHLPPPVEVPKPLLEAPSVLRIWVNYWIDASGDLHQPGYIYSEVTARRWNVGTVAAPPIRSIQPLQVLNTGTTEDGTKEQEPPSATRLLPPV
ncbi:MAG: type IV conjugative transfer system protein TraV, partial [Burkholderiales bacterium]